MKPLGNRVLVSLCKPPERTDGGLYIPEVSQDNTQIATVLELGTGELNDKGERVPFEFKVGQNVLIDKNWGTTVEIAGKRCRILEAGTVLAVL